MAGHTLLPASLHFLALRHPVPSPFRASRSRHEFAGRRTTPPNRSLIPPHAPALSLPLGREKRLARHPPATHQTRQSAGGKNDIIICEKSGLALEPGLFCPFSPIGVCPIGIRKTTTTTTTTTQEGGWVPRVLPLPHAGEGMDGKPKEFHEGDRPERLTAPARPPPNHPRIPT